MVRFEHPRDQRFRKLWNDFQYQNAVKVQLGDRAEDPVLLPFVRDCDQADGQSGRRTRSCGSMKLDR